MNKKRLYGALCGASLVLAAISCVEDAELYDPTKSEIVANTFNFATTNETLVKIDYSANCQNYVYFEIYEKSPVEIVEQENLPPYYIKNDIKPLYSGYTDNAGKFESSFVLPSYLKEVYVYSPYFFVPRVIQGTIQNGEVDIEATSNVTKATRAVAPGTGNYYTDVIKRGWGQGTADGWQDKLGTYNGTNGKINYEYEYSGTGKDLSISLTDRLSLWNTVASLAHSSAEQYNKDHNTHYNSFIPESYATDADILMAKSGEIALTFLGGNTCFTSSLGYYYYEEGNAPKSYAELKKKVVLIFPNTSDGTWEYWNNYNISNEKIGVDRGTCVQLKYWENYDFSKEGTTVFPANYRIGFILATDAWTNYLSSDIHKWDPGKNGARFATNRQASVTTRNGNTVPTKSKTAVYRQTLGEGDDRSYVIIGFEDSGLTAEDGPTSANFTDVVFTTKTNPIDAMEVNEVEDIFTESTTTEGIYCFEDKWPEQYDYDMNDVMVRYEHSAIDKTITTTHSTTVGSETTTDVTQVGPNLDKEVFIFTTFKNVATLPNEWAFKITNAEGNLDNALISCTANGESVQLTKEDNNLFLMGLVGISGETCYKVTIDWSEASLPAAGKSDIQCFIFRPSESGHRLEIHIPYEQPTNKMDGLFFGTGDDRTNISLGNWFTCEGNYPFAFFLAGATEEDLSEMLNPENESKKISTLYPKFNAWAVNKGTINSDWYKK